MNLMNRSPDQIITVPKEKIASLEHWVNTARDGLVEDHWKGIAESIAKEGLQQHPRAWWDEDIGLWVPVFGHHRFAAMLFGLKWEAIPFIPFPGRPTLAQLRELQWIENNTQLAMKPMEKARAAIGIRDANQETNTATAERLRIKSVSNLTDWENWITVLDKAQQDSLDSGLIGESVASWLARCSDAAVRQELFQQAVAKKVGRDQVKAAVQKANGGARKYERAEGEAKEGDEPKAKPITLKGEKGALIRIEPGQSAEELYTLVGRVFRAAEAAKKSEDIKVFGSKLS